MSKGEKVHHITLLYIYNRRIKNENKCNGYIALFSIDRVQCFNLLKVEVVKCAGWRSTVARIDFIYGP